MAQKMLSININGNPYTAPAGMTILEAAKENGIEIPTLCYLKDYSPIGACRVCVVEVEGSRTLVGSCHTPIAEGMIVRTHTPRVVETRKVLIELMMASHPDSCIICNKANICGLRKLCADYDIGLPRFRLRKHFFQVEEENTAIIRDMSKCILCRRCVIACKNLAGEHLFSMGYRGFETKVIYGMDQPLDSNETCAECDTCISYCPTGALRKPMRAGEEKKGQVLYLKG